MTRTYHRINHHACQRNCQHDNQYNSPHKFTFINDLQQHFILWTDTWRKEGVRCAWAQVRGVPKWLLLAWILRIATPLSSIMIFHEIGLVFIDSTYNGHKSQLLAATCIKEPPLLIAPNFRVPLGSLFIVETIQEKGGECPCQHRSPKFQKLKVQLYVGSIVKIAGSIETKS